MRTAGFCPPLMLTRPTPGKLRNLLRQPRVRQVFHLRQRNGVGRQSQSQDRAYRRGSSCCKSAESARSAGKIGLRSVDRRLHFLLRDVDVQVQRELQDDHRASIGARRGHLAQARHLPELPFQRRRHCRCRHIRACARIKRHHLNRRVVDFRQRRNRQLRETPQVPPAESPPSTATSRPAAE